MRRTTTHALEEAAARYGIAILDRGAEAVGTMLDAVRNEIATEIGMLGKVLRTLKAVGSELGRIEDWPTELADKAMQLGVTTATELETVVQAELETLEAMDRDVASLDTDVAGEQEQ